MTRVVREFCLLFIDREVVNYGCRTRHTFSDGQFVDSYCLTLLICSKRVVLGDGAITGKRYWYNKKKPIDKIFKKLKNNSLKKQKRPKAYMLFRSFRSIYYENFLTDFFQQGRGRQHSTIERVRFRNRGQGSKSELWPLSPCDPG